MSQHFGGEKSTKSGHWRTVPISQELRTVIVELRDERGSEDFVLPRLTGWKSGFAGTITRDFLKEIGIEKDIVFHTLRACFATHLLELKLLKLCKSEDGKTLKHSKSTYDWPELVLRALLTL